MWGRLIPCWQLRGMEDILEWWYLEGQVHCVCGRGEEGDLISQRI